MKAKPTGRNDTRNKNKGCESEKKKGWMVIASQRVRDPAETTFKNDRKKTQK